MARSLAASWLHAGRTAIARSFRLHRPRGAFCHRGWCQQCKVCDADGRVVLACTIDEGASARPSPSIDPLRAIGRVAEPLPPWFWEQHAKGPGPLRQPFLDAMRRLSSAKPLSASTANASREPVLRRDCDTLVVGGGVAGVTAANALAASGRRVILVEAQSLGAVATGGVECFERMLCVGLYEDPRHALCVGERGNLTIRYRDLVIATGAYDRLPTVPGNDLPGIVGLRAFETLAAARAVPDGARVGIYGQAIESQRALTAAADASARIAFVAGPGALPMTAATRLPNSRLERVEGARGVERVVLAGHAPLECDLLVVGFSQPSYDLQAQNGCAVELRGDPPVIWPIGAGRAPMLVVGEAAGGFETNACAERGTQAVARWLAGNAAETPEWTRVASPVPPAKPDDAAFVCLCEDVRVRDIRAAVASGYRDIELIKRHTGAATGPCQGKLCHGALVACGAELGVDVRIPTQRPLVRPVSIAQLAGSIAPASQP